MLVLFSCGELDMITPDDETEDTESNDGHTFTAEWTPIPSEIVSGEVYDVSSAADVFVETKNVIVFSDTRASAMMCYMSKATGETYPLCTDPICGHNEETDKCAASAVDSSTANGLCYSRNDGRLYFLRRTDYYSDERQYSIYSIPIDDMDTTVTEHYRCDAGDEISTMRYCDGSIYFTEYYYDSDSEEYGVTLYRLNTHKNAAEKLLDIPHESIAYYIDGNVLYYYDTNKSILYAYDLDTNERKELINRGELCGYHLVSDGIVCQSASGIYKYTFDGELQETLYTSDVEAYRFDLDIFEDQIYFYGYTPAVVEDPMLGEFTNYSGGKIFLLKDGTAQLYYEFADSAEIMSINAIGDALFVRIMENKVSDFYVLYESGGKIVCYTVPLHE